VGHKQLIRGRWHRQWSALNTEQVGLIQPHFGWLLSMKQIGQRLAGIGRTHKSFAHQEGMHMRLTHFLHIC
jgi:hypothetical protein